MRCQLSQGRYSGEAHELTREGNDIEDLSETSDYDNDDADSSVSETLSSVPVLLSSDVIVVAGFPFG